MSSLAQHHREMVWQEYVYDLVEIGISEKVARQMVGWAGKYGYTATQIMGAIANLKAKRPSTAQAWGFWRRALGGKLYSESNKARPLV